MRIFSILLLSLFIFACQDSTDSSSNTNSQNNGGSGNSGGTGDTGGADGSGASFLASNSSFHSALAKNIQSTTTAITENGSEANSVKGLTTFSNTGKIAAGSGAADDSQLELWLTEFASDYATYFENDGAVKQDAGKDYVVVWEAAAADDLDVSLKSANGTTFDTAKVTFSAATTPKNAHTKVQVGSTLLASDKSVVIFLRVYSPETTVPTFSSTPSTADAPLIEWRFTLTKADTFTASTDDMFSVKIGYGADLAAASSAFASATYVDSNRAVISGPDPYINFPEFKTKAATSVVALLGELSLLRAGMTYPVQSIKLTGVSANSTVHKLSSVNNNSCTSSCVSVSSIPTTAADDASKTARVWVEIIDLYGQVYPVGRFDILFIASS